MSCIPQLCDKLDNFYAKEIIKLENRKNIFEKIRQFWNKK